MPRRYPIEGTPLWSRNTHISTIIFAQSAPRELKTNVYAARTRSRTWVLGLTFFKVSRPAEPPRERLAK